jgi:hypothetical protein
MEPASANGFFGLPSCMLLLSPPIGIDPEGKQIYKMRTGETLVFEDGRSGYDWRRLRGCQDVDYIRFYPE